MAFLATFGIVGPLAPPASGLRDWLLNAIALLSIFCFIQLLPLDAEVQPFGAVLAGLFLALYGTRLRTATLAYLAVLGAGLALTLGRHALFGQPAMGTAFATFLAIAAPVLVFAALLGETHRLKPGIVLVSLAAWLFVGVTQMFLPQLQAALGLDRILSALISRYAEEAAFELNRGASLLAPEPSYAAHIIFLFFVAVACLARRGALGRGATTLAFLGVALLAFLNRSGSAAMVAFAFGCAYLALRVAARRDAASFALLGAAVLGPVALLVSLPPEHMDGFRAAAVLAAFLEELWRGELDVVAFTMGFGSIRTISVLTAIHAVVSGGWLGDGLGSWSYRFIDQLFELGINPWELFFFYSKGALVDIKPYSHMAILAFDLGVLGVALDVALLVAAFRAAGPLAALLRDPLAGSIVLVSVVAIVGNTLVSLPAYWVTLALGLDLVSRSSPSSTPREVAC